jgi:hypothetical protein
MSSDHDWLSPTLVDNTRERSQRRAQGVGGEYLDGKEETMSEEEEEVQIESIIGHKMGLVSKVRLTRVKGTPSDEVFINRQGCMAYHVRWTGYGDEDISWVEEGDPTYVSVLRFGFLPHSAFNTLNPSASTGLSPLTI